MVMKVLLLCMATCLLVVRGGDLINRCVLARILHEEELDEFEGYTLSDWLCLAFVESNFNISKVNENVDGSFDYGIFQINSHYWCNDHLSHSENFCHVDCQDLLEPTLLPSIYCAKKIVSGLGGMKNWNPPSQPSEHWQTGFPVTYVGFGGNSNSGLYVCEPFPSPEIYFERRSLTEPTQGIQLGLWSKVEPQQTLPVTNEASTSKSSFSADQHFLLSNPQDNVPSLKLKVLGGWVSQVLVKVPEIVTPMGSV